LFSEKAHRLGLRSFAAQTKRFIRIGNQQVNISVAFVCFAKWSFTVGVSFLVPEIKHRMNDGETAFRFRLLQQFFQMVVDGWNKSRTASTN
jgi:hypothetical protein